MSGVTEFPGFLAIAVWPLTPEASIVPARKAWLVREVKRAASGSWESSRFTFVMVWLEMTMYPEEAVL